MKRFSIPILIFFCVFLSLGSQSFALVISPIYTLDNAPQGTVWDDNKKLLVEDAMKEWTDRLCQDITIFIDFQLADLAGTTLGETTDMVEDPFLHLPFSATVTMDTGSELSWDLSGVDNDHYDALSVLKHEVGHAIGFSGNYTKFASLIKYDGTNKVFDSNNNNLLDAGDYDLYDHPQTHLADSNDLMYPTFDKGERKHPSEADLDILHIAFGYPVKPIPEPSTILLLTVGLLGVLKIRNKTNHH